MQITVVAYRSEEDLKAVLNPINRDVVKSIPEFEAVVKKYEGQEVFLGFYGDDGTDYHNEATARYAALSMTSFEVEELVRGSGGYMLSTQIARKMSLPDELIEKILEKLRATGQLKCEPGIGWRSTLVIRPNGAVLARAS